MTYSIVARDPETGEIGVAVQTAMAGVGAVVPWAEAGVGAVATQAFAEVAYGPRGLAALRGGASAPYVLAELIGPDPGAAVRQVAVVDAQGTAAAHTGEMCVREAGSAHGLGFSVQANMMAKPTVWGAMAEAYTAARGDLAARMLAALDAAEAEGGDLRGGQSAALVVVAAERAEAPGHGVVLDTLVDNHVQPLTELRRLVDISRAYLRFNVAVTAVGAGDLARALELGQQAASALPTTPDPVLVVAGVLQVMGRPTEARAAVEQYAGDRAVLSEYARRFAERGMFPFDANTASTLFA